MKSSGFTLIEIMVAVTLFVMVAFVATTTLLTINAAYKKSQAIKLAMDNLNFALDSMTLRAREGNRYTIDDNNFFSFRDFAGCDNRYSFDSDKQQIIFNRTIAGKCDEIEIRDLSVTSPEVRITSFHLIETNISASSLNRVTVLVAGEAGNSLKKDTLAQFAVQTTIMQRNRGGNQ